MNLLELTLRVIGYFMIAVCAIIGILCCYLELHKYDKYNAYLEQQIITKRLHIGIIRDADSLHFSTGTFTIPQAIEDSYVFAASNVVLNTWVEYHNKDVYDEKGILIENGADTLNKEAREARIQEMSEAFERALENDRRKHENNTWPASPERMPNQFKYNGQTYYDNMPQ